MGLQKVKDDFEKTMAKMLDRTNSPQAGFARIYKVYQRLQTERFMTENSSEGRHWDKLDPQYANYKKRRYGGGPRRGGGEWKSYPGNGNKMLIATSTLAGAVIGPGEGSSLLGTDKHRAMFTSQSMTISVEQSGVNAEGRDFVYPTYVNEDRPFMEFSSASIAEMKQELMKFIFSM